LAAAGHPGPVSVNKNGQAEHHDLSGNPIGFFPTDSATFAEAEIPLGPGERIYFFSDGVVETMDAKQTIIGNERLAEAMAKARTGSLEGDLTHIEHALDAWRQGAPPTDDVSIIVMERTI
jgi:sigma-B regulation protein RsbU (phosphoserine phosphatase)